MKLRDIKELVKLLENSEIRSIEVKKFGQTVKISKNGDAPGFMPAPQINPPSLENTSTKVPKEEIKTEDKKEEKKKSKVKTITSPIVGTFYRKPSPESGPFVSVGDQVNIGDVVCIVEAMKIMNEIESEITGKITKILVEDGHMVEFGQDLFEVE